MPRRKYKYEVICPRCRTEHVKATNIEWTGTSQQFIYCKKCKENRIAFGYEDQYRTYTKKEKTVLIGLTKTRGITQKEKQQFDKECDMLGWKFRQKLKLENITC